MHDLRRFIESVEEILDSHRLNNEGEYRRWNRQSSDGIRDLGLNEYGCADAANILYMIGRFPRDITARAGWIGTLRSLQSADTGLYTEATHHPLHTTAHCIAALELFDASPSHKLSALEKYAMPGGVEELLNGLDWENNPWTASHEGAGVYAALVLANEADREWEDRYFGWLWENQDPATGFWPNGKVHPVLRGDSFSGTSDKPSLFPHLAGAFHYLFNHEYARRPLRYPESLIDTCLAIYSENMWPKLGKSISFAEIDWVYCLTRPLRQSGHRYNEVKDALKDFMDKYIPWLLSLDCSRHDGLNDLHTLFGCICCLAELQSAFPGKIATDRPLKLVLDRRPFI